MVSSPVRTVEQFFFEGLPVRTEMMVNNKIEFSLEGAYLPQTFMVCSYNNN